MVVGGRHGERGSRGRPRRRLTKLPARIPSLIEDLEHGHVDLRSVPGIVAVSAVSLIGGASLGPEQALGSMGGGAAEWASRRRPLNDEDEEVNTLTGFAGAYGGLFSSTVIVVMLILEIARPSGQRMTKTLVATIVSSSVSFGIYFVVGGAFFLDAYRVPSCTFEDWQRGRHRAGLFAAVVVAACHRDEAGTAGVRPTQGAGHRSASDRWPRVASSA